MAIAPLKREIGSEFWNVPTKTRNRLFPKDTQWYLSGRSALQAIISDLKGMHSVALPSWCCDCMIKPFADAGFEIHFYSVYWNGVCIVQDVNYDCDVLLVMDYFGYSAYKVNLSGYRGVIIRDVTHSLFSSSYSDADYYFGSLRKWCGVWTGGFAWTKDNHKLIEDSTRYDDYVDLRENAMNEKAKYIQEKASVNKSYLKLFEEAEEKLDHIGASPAADRDVLIAQKIDKKLLKNRRRENAKIIREKFKELLIFPKMNATDSPLFVPIFIPDGKRDLLRQYLIKNQIYCPVHWPITSYHKLNKKTRMIYETEISLVCDQRYGLEDMFRLCECVDSFLRYN